jgi:3-oxoacyl-(acyl-carrier-protein) synthase
VSLPVRIEVVGEAGASPWPECGLPPSTRMDDGTRRAIVAADRALREAAASGHRLRDSERTLLWLAREEGSIAVDREYWRTAATEGGAFASPALFASTLPSAAAAVVALAFGLRGPVLVVTGGGTAPSRPPRAVARSLGADYVVAVVIGPDSSSASVESVGTGEASE